MIDSGNLKGTAVKGLFWSAVERFGSQGIQFVFGVLITRILSPADYGLVGMILIFVALGQTLVDSGFGSALIWKKNSTDVEKSTVFFFNISVSVILYLLFYSLAPLISDFYSEPQLIKLVRILCLNFIILSFSLIQQVDLQKRVDFRTLAAINISGSLIAGILSLVMALKGFGVWSIVAQMLAKSFITSLFLWVFNRWRPTFVFSIDSLKKLFNYGSKLMTAGLIYTIFQNLYFNIIGKLFPVTSLGYYTRAVQLQEFPVKTVANIFQRVAFPVFATIQDENERLKNALRKTLRTMVFVTFPLLFGLIAIADNLIEVVLTEKWLPASDYFKLLCLVGLFYNFQIINSEILKTKGKPGWILKLEIITRVIWVINIFVTYRWSISAIIIGQLVAMVVVHIIHSHLVWKLIGYSLWHQIKDIFVYLKISTLMFILISFISDIFSNSLISLIIMILVGSIFYVVISIILNLDEINETRFLLKSFKR